MKKVNYMLGLVAVVLLAVSAVQVFADAGISDPVIAVKEFTPSGGQEFKDQVKSSLDSLSTAVKAVIDVADVAVPAVISLTVTGADLASAGTGTATIQAKDAAGDNLAAVLRVRTWVGTANDYGPDALTGFAVGASGTLLKAVTANADLDVVTTTNGVAVINLNAGGADSVWVWAEIQGKIYASGEIVLTAP